MLHQETISNTAFSARNISFGMKSRKWALFAPPFAAPKIKRRIKKEIEEATLEVEGLTVSIESLSWIDDIDETELMQINDALSHTRDLCHFMMKIIYKFREDLDDKILSVALDNLEYSITDLQEVVDDVNSTFFHLPKVEGFNEITKALSLI